MAFSGPLAGTRVLDLAGPSGLYCTKLLADLGADVIKAEQPDGDPTRRRGPFLHEDPAEGNSLYFYHYNTNKRSITLDIEPPDGRALLRRLPGAADVLVETFDPGYLDGLGLGYQSLKADNPRLVFCSITPFGQTGPYRDYKGSDLVAQAMGGVLYLCGWPDRPPVNMGGSQAYHQAGAQAAVGVLLALNGREVTGSGQHVDVSIQECLPMCLLVRLPTYLITGEYEHRGGDSHRSPMFGVFPCRDGYVDIRFNPRRDRWGRALAWINAAGMAGDLVEDRYDDFEYRARPEVARHIDEFFRAFFLTLTKEDLMDQAQRHGLVVGAVYRGEDIVRDPQLQAREFFVPLHHPDPDETIIYPGAPYRLSQTPWQLRSPAPALGQDNLIVYQQELGLSTEEMVALKQGGVI